MDEIKGKMIGQGYTAEIYNWGNNDDKILKLYRQNLPVSLCQSEYTITRDISNQFGICPKVYQTVNINGRNGIVFEKIVGKTMLQELSQNIFTLSKYARTLAQYHVSFQKDIDFELPTVKEKLKKDLQRVSELSADEKEVINRYIARLPDGRALCHFDFHPGNVMMRNREPVIIDWMTACMGSPLSDAARTSVLLKYADFPSKSKLLKRAVKGLKQKLYQGYIKEYLVLTGTDQHQIDIWEFPIAAARLCEWIPAEEKKLLLAMVRSKLSEIQKTADMEKSKA